MEGVLNQNEFDPPRREQWILRARGWETEESAHSGGLRDPREVKLRRGTQLFRIGHSRGKDGSLLSASYNLSRSWWMEAETFNEIAISADTIKTDRQYMARLKLSVAEGFGLFDLIFWVRLRESLGAFRGLGNPVYELPSKASPNPPPAWAWPGREVMQCYIPGLCDLENKPTELYLRAFDVLTKSPLSVHSWTKIDNGLLKPGG